MADESIYVLFARVLREVFRDFFEPQGSYPVAKLGRWFLSTSTLGRLNLDFERRGEFLLGMLTGLILLASIIAVAGLLLAAAARET